MKYKAAILSKAIIPSIPASCIATTSIKPFVAMQWYAAVPIKKHIKTYTMIYKLILSITLTLLFVGNGKAQVQDYHFEQNTDPYFLQQFMNQYNYLGTGAYGRDIYDFSSTAGTAPTTASSAFYKLYNGVNNEKDTSILWGSGYSIGFPFVLDNNTFNSFALSSNGIVQLGNGIFSIKKDTVPSNIFLNNATNTIYGIMLRYADFNKMGCRSIVYDMGGFPGRRMLAIPYRFNDTIITAPQNPVMTAYTFLFENCNGILIRPQSDKIGLAVRKVVSGLKGNTSSSVNIRKIVLNENKWASSLLSIQDTIADINDSLSVGIYSPANDQGYFPTLNHFYYPANIYTTPACQQVFIKSGIKYDNSYTLANYAYWYKYLDSAKNIPRNPTIGWTGGNPFDTTYRYDVYVDTDNPPTQKLFSGLIGLEATLPMMAANTRYYYKVTATNSKGNTQNCVASWFETGKDVNLGNCAINLDDSAGFKYLNYSINDWYIKEVKLQNINYVATNNFLARVVEFPEKAPYTTTLRAGEIYPLKITENKAGVFQSEAVIGIDFDHNGQIDYVQPEPGYPLEDSLDVVATTLPLDSIHMPFNAVPGKTFLSIQVYPRNKCFGQKVFPVTILPRAGCESFTITPVIKNAGCYDNSTGSITLNISGGTKPYNIVWQDKASLQDSIRPSLPKGTYKADITDATGCMLTTDLITIKQPAVLNAESIVTQPSGNTKGSIHTLVQGGTNPYSYQWSTGDATPNINNLNEGVYSVTITDSNGCVSTLNNMRIAGTVPILLTGFTGNIFNNNNVLQWQTATEINSSYFSVQKSIDGINFKNIAQIPAKGFSNTIQQYNYTDSIYAPLGNGNFYRLQVVDKDGSFIYSNIISLHPIPSALYLLPNPATQSFIIKGLGASSINTIIIQTIEGKTVKQFANTNKQSFDISDLPAGVYIININNKKQLKLIKQ